MRDGRGVLSVTTPASCSSLARLATLHFAHSPLLATETPALAAEHALP